MSVKTSWVVIGVVIAFAVVWVSTIQGPMFFLEVLKLIATLIVAYFAGKLTYNQYRVQRAKFKFDLFDKRYEHFFATWKLCSTYAMGTTEQKRSVLNNFTNEIPSARFLFGDEIADYMYEVSKNAFGVNMHAEIIRLPKDEAARVASVAAHLELTSWFLEEADKGVKDRFAPFLDFKEWK